MPSACQNPAARRLLPAVGLALALLGLLQLACRSSRDEYRAANETRAIGKLRSLHTALYDHASRNPKVGFPASLLALQSVDPSLDADLLRGRALRGYIFAYSPGRPDATGAVTTYTLWARPETYGESGHRSFFTDESQVVRFTRGDRPATSNDPLIE
jgi:hypothetical protein